MHQQSPYITANSTFNYNNNNYDNVGSQLSPLLLFLYLSVLCQTNKHAVYRSKEQGCIFTYDISCHHVNRKVWPYTRMIRVSKSPSVCPSSRCVTTSCGMTGQAQGNPGTRPDITVSWFSAVNACLWWTQSRVLWQWIDTDLYNAYCIDQSCWITDPRAHRSSLTSTTGNEHSQNKLVHTRRGRFVSIALLLNISSYLTLDILKRYVNMLRTYETH